MLAVGLPGGYFGRSLLQPQPPAITAAPQSGVAPPKDAPAISQTQSVDPVS